MENYELVKELGSGNFGTTHLMKDKQTGEMVAVKKLPRGSKINKNVYREVLNHRKLSHPNIIGFKCIKLDDKHLNVVMEYAAGIAPCACPLMPSCREGCGRLFGSELHSCDFYSEY